MKKKLYDQVGGIIAYESGELDDEQVMEMMQELVNSGMVWTLQGSYGRYAAKLLEEGKINPAKVDHKDTGGNIIPAGVRPKNGQWPQAGAKATAETSKTGRPPLPASYSKYMGREVPLDHWIYTSGVFRTVTPLIRPPESKKAEPAPKNGPPEVL